MAVLVVGLPAWGQRLASNGVRLPDDLVSIRQLADQGSIQAQLALGKKFLAMQHPADALIWYRKTAEKDCMDGVHQVGQMLLFGAASQYPGQRVESKPAEGIKWTYRAATNSYTTAFRSMSTALQRGLGVKTNLVEAYAWMKLYAEAEPEVGHPLVEMLGLKLPTDVLVEGRKLASELNKGHWPPLQLAVATSAVVPEAKAGPLVSLKLTGVTLGGRSPLAVINRRTFGPGESAKVPLEAGHSVSVKCLEIREDSVLVAVEGEADPRSLQFDTAVGVVATQ